MKTFAVIVLLVVLIVLFHHSDGFRDEFSSRVGRDEFSSRVNRDKMTAEWLSANPTGTYAQYRRDLRGNILDFNGM
jgi:hypothetical protein